MTEVTKDWNSVCVLSGTTERSPGFEISKEPEQDDKFKVAMFQDDGTYCHFDMGRTDIKALRDRLTAMLRTRKNNA